MLSIRAPRCGLLKAASSWIGRNPALYFGSTACVGFSLSVLGVLPTVFLFHSGFWQERSCVRHPIGAHLRLGDLYRYTSLALPSSRISNASPTPGQLTWPTSFSTSRTPVNRILLLYFPQSFSNSAINLSLSVTSSSRSTQHTNVARNSRVTPHSSNV